MSGNQNCLWFGEMDYYMDETFISRAFYSAGEPAVGVKMIRHKTTGALASYCFVEFEDQFAAERVLAKLNGKVIPGTNPEKTFKLNHAVYGKDNPNYGVEYSLFVGDLTPEVNDQTLLTFFQIRYPSVKAAKVVTDSLGKPKGFGFVRFFDEMEINRALVEMQNAVGCGRKPIRCSPATNKSRRIDKPQHSYTSNTAVPSMTPNAQYYSQYDQYNQQYQQYIAAWNQQQQQQQQQQHMTSAMASQAAPMSWDQYYQSYYQQNAEAGTTEDAKDDELNDQTPVDPDTPLDIAALNKELIETESRLYIELDESRWHPLDTPFVTVPSAPVLT